MKKYTAFVAAALLATSTLLYAGNDHSHSDSVKAGGSPMNSMAGQSGMMGMSADMQAKMKKMKIDMAAIQKEKDSAKRKAMIRAHMMDMKGMMGMMKDKKMMMQSKHTEQMEQFGTRLSMMEAMVEQMLNSHITALDPEDPVYLQN